MGGIGGNMLWYLRVLICMLAVGTCLPHGQRGTRLPHTCLPARTREKRRLLLRQLAGAEAMPATCVHGVNAIGA